MDQDFLRCEDRETGFFEGFYLEITGVLG